MVGGSGQRGMFAWTVFAVLALRLSAAEVQPPAPVSYRVTRYTAEQGLPQNSIRALLQTRDGYIWVGTLAGLARFDGVTFDVFNAHDTPEMSHDAINALAEDREDGSLWINTGKGLLRYHQHRFERFVEEEGVPHPFGRLWPAREGGLWYSPHPGQLVRLQNRTVRSWQLRPRRVAKDGDEIVGHQINQVEEEEGETLLVMMHVGLFRFVPATGDFTWLGPPQFNDQSCRGFLSQTNGTILVAAREGLWRGRFPALPLPAPRGGTRPTVSSRRESAGTANALSAGGGPAGPGTSPGGGQPGNAEWELIEPVDVMKDRQCPARIHLAGDGAGWIPWSREGPPRIARFTAGRSEFLDLSRLPDYPMNEFLQDREGHLWLGTESGLCQLRPKAVRVYAREDGLRNDNVKTVTEGPDGTIWLGSDGGVSGIRDGQVTNLPPGEPANWGRAEGLLADRRGRLWYGALANSVATFEHGDWVSSPLSLGESWLRTLYEDRQGRVWGGFDRGVAWLDEAGIVQAFPHTLSHPDVRVIHQDRRGDMWFGTYGGGLNRLHDGQIASYATTLGEYNNRAWCIHEDADGVFWIGTRNGLNRFVPPGVSALNRNLDLNLNRPSGAENESKITIKIKSEGGTQTEGNGTFFTFTTRHGLHENIVNNIQEDDLGHLWLSGPQGIYRVSRQELNNVAAGHQSQAQVLAFGEADGMLNSQCNGGVNQPSGCKDRTGRIWFPTARGVAMVDPRTIRRNEVPPPVVIEQVRADEEIVYGDGVAGSSSKSEIRNPKQIRSSKSEKSRPPHRLRRSTSPLAGRACSKSTTPRTASPRRIACGSSTAWKATIGTGIMTMRTGALPSTPACGQAVTPFWSRPATTTMSGARRRRSSPSRSPRSSGRRGGSTSWPGWPSLAWPPPSRPTASAGNDG